MAGRIRTIKPELLDDEKASALSDAAWRLFVGSFLIADDHGRFRAGVKYLAATIWQDTTAAKKAEKARNELVAAGRIRVYEVGGDTYAEIPTWTRHQRIDNAGAPRIPVPNDSAVLPPIPRRTAESRREPPRVSANRGESPRTSASLGEPPLARGAARPPTSDHDLDQRPPSAEPAAALGDGPSSEPPGEVDRMARELAAMGNKYACEKVEKLDALRPLTKPEREAIRKIHAEQSDKPTPRSRSPDVQGGTRDEARTREVQAATQAQREAKFGNSPV